MAAFEHSEWRVASLRAAHFLHRTQSPWSNSAWKLSETDSERCGYPTCRDFEVVISINIEVGGRWRLTDLEIEGLEMLHSGVLL